MKSALSGRSQRDLLQAKISERHAVIGIVGMGYVGLPLALAAVEAGFSVIGFDTNPQRVSLLNAGRSGFKHIDDEIVLKAVDLGRMRVTGDFKELHLPDAILIAVPTPLSKQREPDLSYVKGSAVSIAAHLRPGQLIVLESTTWPGTTREVVQPILDSRGLSVGSDYFLAYSPEREDPGNGSFSTTSIPKVVGADDDTSMVLACLLYESFIERVVPVSSAMCAEAVKLTENIFRSVNIALVNELKMIYAKMGIDIWEVIEAAKTKPFGYMPFYPGPGLGGHCIPIDPYYLAWKAREFETTTRFIELAGEINTHMPYYVVQELAAALDRFAGKGLRDARVMIVGLAYKKNVDDIRESPSLKLIDLLEARGSEVHFHDPLIEQIPSTRAYISLEGRKSVPLSQSSISSYDAILIATDHDVVDWDLITRHGKVIIDTRNACARSTIRNSNIIKA